jgi:hypothetical protein
MDIDAESSEKFTSKSKCVTFPSRYLNGSPDHEPLFHIGNNVIENTQQIVVTPWSNALDHTDIAKHRNCFIGQVNNLLC